VVQGRIQKGKKKIKMKEIFLESFKFLHIAPCLSLSTGLNVTFFCFKKKKRGLNVVHEQPTRCDQQPFVGPKTNFPKDRVHLGSGQRYGGPFQHGLMRRVLHI
jgi:hypothetical protein